MKLTRKEISNKYQVISVGYCRLQNLLQYERRLGYTTSQTYGWRSDNFLIFNETKQSYVVISTGYDPVNGIKPSYELTEKYDNKAQDIVSKHDKTYQERKDLLDELKKSL